jgi:hypothetical protein
VVLRPRLPAIWRLSATGALTGAVLSRALKWLEGAPFVWPETFFLMGATASAALLTWALMPSKADAEGLHLPDSLGLRRRVRWDQIETVELRPWWAMWRAPALAVTTRDGKRRWLLRESHGLDDLHKLALQVASPAHPLVRALETPLHRL